MKNKIIVGIMIMSLIVLLIIGVILFQLGDLEEAHLRTTIAGDMNNKINDLGLQFFKIQLEICEYSYDPIPSKLEDFNSQKDIVDEKIEILGNFLEQNKKNVYDGGIKDFEKFLKDLEIIKEKVNETIESLVEYSYAKNMNYSDKKIEELRKFSRVKMFELDEFADEKGIDRLVENFISNQGKLLEKEITNISDIQKLIEILMVSLAGAYLILLILIAIWLRSFIKKK